MNGRNLFGTILFAIVLLFGFMPTWAESRTTAKSRLEDEIAQLTDEIAKLRAEWAKLSGESYKFRSANSEKNLEKWDSMNCGNALWPTPPFEEKPNYSNCKNIEWDKPWL